VGGAVADAAVWACPPRPAPTSWRASPFQAWRGGVKRITVYRYASKPHQVLS
jgi:ribonucleotide reductase alpha subunit